MVGTFSDLDGTAEKNDSSAFINRVQAMWMTLFSKIEEPIVPEGIDVPQINTHRSMDI